MGGYHFDALLFLSYPGTAYPAFECQIGLLLNTLYPSVKNNPYF